jgi:hypothetical protein
VRTGEATPSELASSAAGGEDMWVVRWGAEWWEKVREARRGGERARRGGPGAAARARERGRAHRVRSRRLPQLALCRSTSSHHGSARLLSSSGTHAVMRQHGSQPQRAR